MVKKIDCFSDGIKELQNRKANVASVNIHFNVPSKPTISLRIIFGNGRGRVWKTNRNAAK